MKRSPTFCIVPWVQLATNATGNYRVCCNGIPGKSLVMDENNKPMKVAKSSAVDVWNSDSYKNLRQQFLDGERPAMCERCFREEDSGVVSARQKWNEKWVSDSESKADPDFDVKYIDLRLGNLCNLKCRMCNPYASSKWVDEWNTVADKAELVPDGQLPQEEIDRLRSIEWQDLDKSWKNLEPALKTVDEIYLTGGEPLLSLRQVEFLKKLVDSGNSKSVKLKYNTNLTTLPAKLFDIWPEFKHVQLNVSVDGVGELDEYIRHPTTWEKVEGYLDQLFKLEQNVEPIHLGVHCTVQMYNILHLQDLLEYFQNKYNKLPYLNILNHPKCLNIRTLPLELKEKVSMNLNPWAHHKGVEEVIVYMSKEDWSEVYFGQFLSYSEALDSNRNQNLSDLNPQFYEI